jgi:colicin import membrane protein
LDQAEAQHAKRAAVIQAQAEAIEKRSQAEDASWVDEKERLQTALRRARD